MSFINNFLKKENTEQKTAPQNENLHQETQRTPNYQTEKDGLQEFIANVPEEAFEQDLPELSAEATSLQEELDLELDLPYKLYGSQATVTEKLGFMGEQIFTFHKLPKEFVTKHLTKIYTGVLYSMAAQDEEFLGEYLEKNFNERLKKSLTDLSKKGYMLRVLNDVTGNRGEPVIPKMEIVDMVVVRGLSVVREENKTDKDYHKFVDIEDMGLVIYTPLDVTNPDNFIDPKQNQAMYDDAGKVLLRLLVQIESPLKLAITRPDGEEIRIEGGMKAFKHTAVFETQMKKPPKFTSANKLETYMEWMMKFKFGVWRLADLDNWMRGNPLLAEDSARDLYKDPVFKGSKYDREATIDLKKV